MKITFKDIWGLEKSEFKTFTELLTKIANKDKEFAIKFLQSIIDSLSDNVSR